MIDVLFSQIRAIAPSAIYIHSEMECIPCPPDTDTASMEFLKEGEFTVGFTRMPTDLERDSVLSLLRFGSLIPTAAQLRQQGARGEAALATQLKTLTPQEAVDYIETNVTTLASAKVVMKLMVRMLIAMRNEIWPDLPDGS